MRDVTFETERLLLRSLEPDDASEQYRSWFNPEIAAMGVRTARRQPSIEELRTFIAERLDRDDVLFLGIFDKAGSSHIGNIKYEPIDSQRAFAVMGILLGEKAWWGKGVAAEVLFPTARWVRQRYGVREIALGVMKDNALARRGYEKVGFRVEPSQHITIDPTRHESMVWHLDEVTP